MLFRSIKNEAIDDEVKKVFTPEFRNRLSKIVVFNGLNREMAIKIVDKEIAALDEKLKPKNIVLKLSKACKNHLIELGISEEYGAREIKRVVDKEIKSLLVDEILFGRLKNGGKCTLDFDKKVFISKVDMEKM